MITSGMDFASILVVNIMMLNAQPGDLKVRISLEHWAFGPEAEGFAPEIRQACLATGLVKMVNAGVFLEASREHNRLSGSINEKG